MAEEQSCDNCRFMRVLTSERKTCCRYAPRPTIEMDRASAKPLALTPYVNWCGEWEGVK